MPAALAEGRRCDLLFQGWGQLINLGVLMVGLLAFNSKGSGPYSHGAAGATYRFSFACIAVLIAWMAYYRTWRMKPVTQPVTSQAMSASPVEPPQKVLLKGVLRVKRIGTQNV